MIYYLWGSEVEAADRDETHPMCVHLKSTGADAERYETLCARYGVLHENPPVITAKMLNGKGLDHCVRYFYPAYSLVSIEVTCEEAYDAEHPAPARRSTLCAACSPPRPASISPAAASACRRTNGMTPRCDAPISSATAAGTSTGSSTSGSTSAE